MRSSILLLLACTFFVSLASTAEQKKESLLNKLFAPGPLIEGHHELEQVDCLKCHDAGKGIPDSKCLDCHDDIAKFVKRKKGFHGLQKKACIKCHSDHKGLKFDSTALDPKKFDHSLTGFNLRGGHDDIKCKDCHTEKRSKKAVRKGGLRYMGLTVSCKSCHKDDDIHYFKGDWAKEDCNACHNDYDWKKKINFKHYEDTKYKLQGKHSKLECAKCHITNKKTKQSIYTWRRLKKDQCLSCHKDVHGKNLSKQYRNGRCTKCHTQKSWKIKSFDHSVTGYKLRFKHKEAKCTDCHRQTKKVLKTKKTKHYKWAGLTQKCLSCHKDFHYFANHKSKIYKAPNQCIDCHNEKDWKQIHDFKHSRDTNYRIDGKHLKMKCNDCHKPTKKKKNVTLALLPGKKPGKYHWKELNKSTCATCHTNPHRKKFSKKFLKKKCTECHVTSGWKDRPLKSKKGFKHSETRFKLTGKHSKIKCSDCHNIKGGQVFKFDSYDKKFCIDCHRSPHKKQFSKDFNSKSCFDCHNTTKFSEIKRFDHDKTNFKLKHKHTKVRCLECHVKDHRARYGKSKKPITWHKFLFPELSKKDCKTCHTDVHKGQLDAKCSSCHQEKNWRKSTFKHNRDSVYKLEGKHRKVKCSECHSKRKGEFVRYGKVRSRKKDRKKGSKRRSRKRRYNVVNYKPLAKDCNSCHVKDDVHKGEFGKSCKQCHTEKSWKYTKDFHQNFNLHGVHFSVDCTECHRDERRLSGMSDNCVLCHQKDDIHSGSLPDCNECHRQQFWEHTKFRHAMTNFALRGSHRALDCFACHYDGRYQGTPSSCTQCHHTDTVDSPQFNHSSVIGTTDCNECHNQFTWDRN